MAKRKIPHNGALPHSTLIPHTRETKRLLTRLSKPALITIATRWLNPVSTRYYGANLSPPEDEDPNSEDEYTAETSIAAYEVLSNNLTIRAKDVAERMLEREWRDGLTLLGVAELEWQCEFLFPSSISLIPSFPAQLTPHRLNRHPHLHQMASLPPFPPLGYHQCQASFLRPLLPFFAPSSPKTPPHSSFFRRSASLPPAHHDPYLPPHPFLGPLLPGENPHLLALLPLLRRPCFLQPLCFQAKWAPGYRYGGDWKCY
jgi:hypothetical protein